MALISSSKNHLGNFSGNARFHLSFLQRICRYSLFLPQFDNVTFLNQLFWITSFLCFFFIFLAHIFLPKLSTLIKLRSLKLENGLLTVLSCLKEVKFTSYLFNFIFDSGFNLFKFFSNSRVNFLLEFVLTWKTSHFLNKFCHIFSNSIFRDSTLRSLIQFSTF